MSFSAWVQNRRIIPAETFFCLFSWKLLKLARPNSNLFWHKFLGTMTRSGNLKPKIKGENIFCYQDSITFLIFYIWIQHNPLSQYICIFIMNVWKKLLYKINISNMIPEIKKHLYVDFVQKKFLYIWTKYTNILQFLSGLQFFFRISKWLGMSSD